MKSNNKEKLTFKNKEGLSLSGVLSCPSDTKDIFILCHAFTTHKERPGTVRFEEEFNNIGINTFKFDFSGHGESEGKFEDITISKAVDDTLYAISFLKDRGFQNISLLGRSFGGLVSLIVATKEKIDLLVLGCPALDYKEIEMIRKGEEGIKKWKKEGSIEHIGGGERKLKLNYTMYEDAENNIGYDYTKNLKTPTLIVHGNSDEIVPVFQSMRMTELNKNIELKIVRGANHRFSGEGHFDKLVEHVLEFVKKK